MVTIKIPEPRQTYSYNVDSDKETVINHNSLEQLADSVGIVDTINQLNQEGHQDYQRLQQENDEVPQEQYPSEEERVVRPRKQKKTKKVDSNEPSRGDVRFDAMSKRIAILSEENQRIDGERKNFAAELESERQSRLLMERQLLEMQQKSLSSEVDKIADISAEAQMSGDIETYKQANKILGRLMVDEANTSSALENFDYELQKQQQVAPNNEDDHLQEMIQSRFLELSDSRELNSDAYQQWLDENPYYDPSNFENYDQELSDSVHEIKREFNKWLKINRQGDIIGTPEYYDELNTLINTQYGVSDPYTDYEESVPEYDQQSYAHDGYEDRGEEMSKMHSVGVQGPNYQRNSNFGSGIGMRNDSPAIMPVSRQGYYTQNHSNDLPPLSNLERQLARSMPMFDTKGNPLDEDAREYQYRIGKKEFNRG